MGFFNKMRQQKLLSGALLLLTLTIGIIIGTVVNTGVHAAKTQSVAPDAMPLLVPSPVKLGNEFTALAKKLGPSVVNITAGYTTKLDPSAQEGGSAPPDEESGGDDSRQGGPELLRHFF